MHIDEKFKDAPPSVTISRIRELLAELDIELVEDWLETGVEHCYALNVRAKDGYLFANGKGVTRELALCSAYGEFIERLQCGLFFYKFRTLEDDPVLNLHSYASDARYVSKAELLEHSDWMEPICTTYGVTKETVAGLCQMYANSEQILTLPYHDVFSGESVYLPAAFVEHIYCTNGCCAGNTREEAWIHALSEMMERHCCIEMMCSDKALPAIPAETLNRFSKVRRILEQVREQGDFTVEVLDCSHGLGYPVIATRIINKKTHRYVVNPAADPILEIAIERSMTELFQGRTLTHLGLNANETILSHANEMDKEINVFNQLETAQGACNATFFTDSKEPCGEFPDYSGLTNEELLKKVLDFYRNLGLRVFVRNCSYLGFPCYFFLVPGFSEGRGLSIPKTMQSYSFGCLSAKALRNLRKADELALQDVLFHHRLLKGSNSREYNFSFLVGLPLRHVENRMLTGIHYAYAAWRLKRQKEVQLYLKLAKTACPHEQTADYLECIRQYLRFTAEGLTESDTLILLRRFFEDGPVARMEASLNRYGDVFDDLLFACDTPNCEGCPHRNVCYVPQCKETIAKAGARYRQFTDGQNSEHFR